MPGCWRRAHLQDGRRAGDGRSEERCDEVPWRRYNTRVPGEGRESRKWFYRGGWERCPGVFLYVPVPNGKVVFSPDDAVKAAKEIAGKIKVVKAQIHAGGRGKGGGVKVAKNIPEVRKYAKQILGMNLVTEVILA